MDPSCLPSGSQTCQAGKSQWIGGFVGQSTVNGLFSSAMVDYRRVVATLGWWCQHLNVQQCSWSWQIQSITQFFLKHSDFGHFTSVVLLPNLGLDESCRFFSAANGTSCHHLNNLPSSCKPEAARAEDDLVARQRNSWSPRNHRWIISPV